MSTFRKKVLKVVSLIPKGKVLSYKQVAVLSGYPNAFRAVASLMKKNQDPNIPCHRVVLSSGYVGDYNRGGSWQKEKVLAQEGVKIEKGKVVF